MTEHPLDRRAAGRPWARDDGVASLEGLREAKAEPGYDGVTCACGSAWFAVTGVTLATSGRATGWSGIPKCVECGAAAVL